MLTVSKKRRRLSMIKSAVLLILGAIIFTPKLDQTELPHFGMPFVSAAVAAEAD
jgi:hypothetical protein